jgi:hypothetical protein
MMKEEFKKKIRLIIILTGFLGSFGLIFGVKNLPISFVILFVSIFTIKSNLSLKPGLSFIKILFTLELLGIIAFYTSSQTTMITIIINFILVFGISFTSFHIFNNNSYIGYLTAYFLMFSRQIPINELPMRLFLLLIGAIFIVGLNLIVNRKKQYKTIETTINSLICEINEIIDLKLKNKKINKNDIKINNDFYLNIYNSLDYNFILRKNQENFLNIAKSLEYINILIVNTELSKKDLNYIKDSLDKLTKKEKINYPETKTKEMYLILLNIKIIENSLKPEKKKLEDKQIGKNNTLKIYKQVIRLEFSKHSIKFSFALKMGLIMSLWQTIGFLFNLPYIKWLYFTSITAILPYTNDLFNRYKTRIKATILGIIIFLSSIIIFDLMKYKPSNLVFGIIIVITIYLIILNSDNRFYRSTFTSILSIIISLMYIPLKLALPLKLIWTSVALITCGIFSFIIMPYSIGKESIINMGLYQKLNNKLISLIKEKCLGNNIEKSRLIILSNLISENIEDNKLHKIQREVNELANIILNYMEINNIKKDIKEDIIKILNNKEVDFTKTNINNQILLNSIKYIINLNKKTKKTLKSIN